jgi:Ni,Fe-hydrogenase maturation factor
MRLGRTMGANLPDEVTVVGIATSHIFDFSEELSPPVAKAVTEATQIVIRLLP